MAKNWKKVRLIRYKEEIIHNESVRHWNMMPREAVNAPFLEMFRVRLDRT